MSGEGNGSGTAKTVKELVLDHDEKLEDIRSELDKAKGALWLAVALGFVNALDTLLSFIPVAARGVAGQ